MEKKLESIGDVRMDDQRESLVPRLHYKRQVQGRGGFNFAGAELKSFGELEKLNEKREALIRKIRCKRQGGRPGCGLG